MCEYIILEDFKMDKYIYDKRNGLWYELQGDYYIPCLELPAEKRRTAYPGMGAAAPVLSQKSPQGAVYLPCSPAAN